MEKKVKLTDKEFNRMLMLKARNLKRLEELQKKNSQKK